MVVSYNEVWICAGWTWGCCRGGLTYFCSWYLSLRTMVLLECCPWVCRGQVVSYCVGSFRRKSSQFSPAQGSVHGSSRQTTTTRAFYEVLRKQLSFLKLPTLYQAQVLYNNSQKTQQDTQSPRPEATSLAHKFVKTPPKCTHYQYEQSKKEAFILTTEHPTSKVQDLSVIDIGIARAIEFVQSKELRFDRPAKIRDLATEMSSIVGHQVAQRWKICMLASGGECRCARCQG